MSGDGVDPGHWSMCRLNSLRYKLHSVSFLFSTWEKSTDVGSKVGPTRSLFRSLFYSIHVSVLGVGVKYDTDRTGCKSFSTKSCLSDIPTVL